MPKKLILVVDDDAISRFLIQGLLKGEDNYVVHTVENGSDCLEFIEHNHVDLVITDVEMDDLSGLEISETLLSNEATAKIPVILLSIRDQYEITRKSKDYCNVKRVVQKPYSVDLLLSNLNEIFTL